MTGKVTECFNVDIMALEETVFAKSALAKCQEDGKFRSAPSEQRAQMLMEKYLQMDKEWGRPSPAHLKSVDVWKRILERLESEEARKS